MEIVSDFLGRQLGFPAPEDRERPREPVVTFIGWVNSQEPGVTRLYPDSWFSTWYEIPTHCIVHQVPGSERPHDECRSVLWVAADAEIKACNAGRAEDFAKTTPAPPVTEAMMIKAPWPHRP